MSGSDYEAVIVILTDYMISYLHMLLKSNNDQYESNVIAQSTTH